MTTRLTKGDSMSDNLGLGKIIETPQQRDAIHIAVAPVVAGEILSPGDHIGFITSSTEVVGLQGVWIGIVDPYLNSNVQPGQRFWMFLYPGSITTLRHEWTHPAFPAIVPVQPSFEKVLEGERGSEDSAVAVSRRWIEGFAAELDQTYSRLMSAAAYWLDGQDKRHNDNYTFDNDETYKDVDYNKWPVFWAHYAVVTGDEIKNKSDMFFTCSC